MEMLVAFWLGIAAADWFNVMACKQNGKVHLFLQGWVTCQVQTSADVKKDKK